jgi:transposase
MWYVLCATFDNRKNLTTNLLAGARLIYLPPYSLDLNPIEETFHFIKTWLRHHEEGQNPLA